MLTLTLTNPNPNLHQWEMQAQVGTLAKSESKESTEFPKFRRVPPSNKTVKFTSTNSFQDYQEPGLDPSIGSGNHPHGHGHDVTTRIESTHGSNTPPLAEGERQAFVNRGDSNETVMEEGSTGNNNNKSFFSTNIIGYVLTYLFNTLSQHLFNITPQNTLSTHTSNYLHLIPLPSFPTPPPTLSIRPPRGFFRRGNHSNQDQRDQQDQRFDAGRLSPTPVQGGLSSIPVPAASDEGDESGESDKKVRVLLVESDHTKGEGKEEGNGSTSFSFLTSAGLGGGLEGGLGGFGGLEGYEVTTSLNGFDALEKLKRKVYTKGTNDRSVWYDAVVTDLHGTMILFDYIHPLIVIYQHSL